MGRQCGFAVEVLAKEKDRERDISSSYIREELTAGAYGKGGKPAGESLLYQRQVIHGRHLGHSLGFPTINQIPEPDKMLPPRGVYVSMTKVAGKRYQSVTNIGKNPR